MEKSNIFDSSDSRTDLQIEQKNVEKSHIREKILVSYLVERIDKEGRSTESLDKEEVEYSAVLEKLNKGETEEALDYFGKTTTIYKYTRLQFLKNNKSIFLSNNNLKEKYIELIKKGVAEGEHCEYLTLLCNVFISENRQEDLFDFIKKLFPMESDDKKKYKYLINSLGIPIHEWKAVETPLIRPDELLSTNESIIEYAMGAFKKTSNIDELLNKFSQEQDEENKRKKERLIGEYIIANASYIVLMHKKYKKIPELFLDEMRSLENVCKRFPEFYKYVSECYAELGLFDDSLRTAKVHVSLNKTDKTNNTDGAELYAKIAAFQSEKDVNYQPTLNKSLQLIESAEKIILQKKGWWAFSDYIYSLCCIASYQKKVGDENFVKTIQKVTSLIREQSSLNNYNFINRNDWSRSTLEDAFYLLFEQKDASGPTADLLKEINRLYGYGVHVQQSDRYTCTEEFPFYLSILKKIRENFPDQEVTVKESIDGILVNFKEGINDEKCRNLILSIAKEAKNFDEVFFNETKKIVENFCLQSTEKFRFIREFSHLPSLAKEYDIKIDFDEIIRNAEKIAKKSLINFDNKRVVEELASVVYEKYGLDGCVNFIENFHYEYQSVHNLIMSGIGLSVVKKGKADGIELIKKGGGLKIDKVLEAKSEIHKNNSVSFEEKKHLFLDSIVKKDKDFWRQIGSLTNVNEQEILSQLAPDNMREEINDNFILSSIYFGKIDESKKQDLAVQYEGKLENLLGEKSSLSNIEVNKNIGMYANILAYLKTDKSFTALKRLVQNYVDKENSSEHVRTILKHLIETETETAAEIAINLLKELRDDTQLIHYIARKLDEKNLLFKFDNLNSDFARNLIKINYTEKILNNLEKFEKLDEELAFEFCKINSTIVDMHADKFIVADDTKTAMKSYGISLSEYAFIRTDLPNIKNGITDKTAHSLIFDSLKNKHEYWKDEQNILNPFETGAEIFGYQNMFKYLDRKGFSRHDGLHNFIKITTLAQASGLEPKAFYNNILEQVRCDDAEYRDGTAHHYLNNIANNISLNWQATKAKIAKYSDVEKLAELARNLEKPEDVFSSWKNLKKYDELSRLLEQADILKQLKELKQSGNNKLYHYIETLAFHPNIAMENVFQFWRNPHKFLELRDSHTPDEVQNRKKPSNYVEIPNLDLSAEELRDALIDGTYDKLQVFKYLAIEYRLPKTDGQKLSLPLLSEVIRALGKRRENIKGEAKNAPKLFKELQNLLKTEQIVIDDFLTGQVELSKRLANFVREKLYDQSIGLPFNKKDVEEYRAKINLKSDPDGVVAGNDTACCMPFGSGKNNVYTFNPNCALFTLQKKNADSTWRTIAQSVLTKDIDINKNVSEVVKAMSGESHLNEIITEDILRQKQNIIACDNIEVSPNFKGGDRIIASIYRDFFNEYLSNYGIADNFDKTKVVIGQGYSDTMTYLPSAGNNFVPKAPVGYSDKLGKSVYVLTLGKDVDNQTASDVSILSREIKTDLQTENKKNTKDTQLPKGVSPLTFEDSLPVAYIEGKAYQDNQNLIEYLHNMENALIAKDINNIAKRRPNMSLKYEDENGMMHGYILAYEGKDDKKNKSVVYVSDLASDSNRRAGGSLILGFTEAYKNNYIDTNHLIPIYAQMREKTSYAIIMKQLEKLSTGSGIEFKIEELGSYKVGGDTMHRLLIKPTKTK